uniref:tRNA N(3)-methylcytidine methyltransferase n=1 Tax=Ascaris lumbricoides TaxID=6252 RepID=A0A0M3HV49_ASCLU
MSVEDISSRQHPVLTEKELKKLEDEEPANEFKRKKLELDAQKNWDKFYKRNKDNFFKDRHWSREDLVLLCPHIDLKKRLIYLEAGCGVGNMLFPLIEYFPWWYFYGFDFSTNAIRLLNQRAATMRVPLSVCVADLCDTQHFPLPLLSPVESSDGNVAVLSSPLCCQVSSDIVNPDLAERIVSDQERSSFSNHDLEHPTSSDTQIPDSMCTKLIGFAAADLTTLIFVLSSIHPEKQAIAIRNLTKLVKKGGTVIVRDYGINDYAMLRFGRGAKLAERFYARQDGTRVFYFRLEELEEIFISEGYRIERSEYLFRKTVNHEKNLCVNRVFVQAVFIKTR